MEANLKNSFTNVLLSTGKVIEYLSSLKSKNLVVPNNRLDKNNNPKYNGIISSLNANINVYNAVLDEFVVELNGTEKAINNLQLRWEQEDLNVTTHKIEIKDEPSIEDKHSSDQNRLQQQNSINSQRQQISSQQTDSSNEVSAGQSLDLAEELKMDIDDDAYLNQFLQGDVAENDMENGLLDFGNAQVNPSSGQPTAGGIAEQQQNQIIDNSSNSQSDIANAIDAKKNPSEILNEGADRIQQAGTTNLVTVKGGKEDDIILDDLEELLASTNDGIDLTYDSNGVPIDETSIFDELNYFLGGEEEE